MILGRGFLRKEYYQTWADYFIRFLDEYSSQGLEMWGLTAQNEPADGRIPDFFFNSMGWTAAEQVNKTINFSHIARILDFSIKGICKFLPEKH